MVAFYCQLRQIRVLPVAKSDADSPWSIRSFFKKMGVPYSNKKIKQVMQEQLTH